MHSPFNLRPLAAAIALLCASAGAIAAPPSQADLVKLVEQLSQRMEKLEQRNADLERELRASRAPHAAPQTPTASAIEQRVQALEAHQVQMERSLESDTIRTWCASSA